MATPSLTRLVFETCRPSKSSTYRLRPFLQCKRSITHTQRFAATDITQGFPDPPTGHHIDLSNIVIPPSSQDVDSEASLRADTSSSSPPSSLESFSSPPTTPSASWAQPNPLPPNVLATHLVPMKHPPLYGLPCASLQLRSYSVRNLEFFADWCLRAAFYLKLPASGPVSLPRKTERWTVLRSNFVHKKSQENFERITYRRLITIMDGHPDVVERWLAFVRKWQFYGVGMKANVWDFSSIDVGGEMDQVYKGGVEEALSEKLKHFGFNESIAEKTSLDRLIRREKRQGGVGSPLSDVRDGSLTDEGRAYKRGEAVDSRE